MKNKRLSAVERAVYGKEPPAPNKHPPEPEFPQNADDWDTMVFDTAVYFTVVVGNSPFNRTKREFKTFPDAVVYAQSDLEHTHAVMLYAVNGEGRHSLMPQKKWPDLLKKWNAKNSTGG